MLVCETMVRTTLLAAFGAFLLLAPCPARAAHAIVVDEVVALVGEEPILRSEVVTKARTSAAMQKADTPAAVERIEREVLESIIETALIVIDASRLGLRVTPLELAQAEKRILGDIGLTRGQLLAELKRRGVLPREYDAVVVAQLLEQKWLALVVKPHVKTPVPLTTTVDADAPFVRELAAERKRALTELRKSIFVEVRW